MSKKRLEIEGIANELEGASAFFPSHVPPSPLANPEKGLQEDLAQNSEQLSKPLSEPLSDLTPLPKDINGEDTLHILTAEDIEIMSFELRRQHKTKVNTEIVDE